MGNLMPDHHANRAIVHGIQRVQIKRWRLQNAGGEHDLIHQRVVVCIRCRRRHAPTPAIHRLADQRPVVRFHKFPSRNHVLEESIPPDLHVAVVLPLVRIPDLRIERRDLRHRLLFRVLAHPRTRKDVVAHRCQKISHHLLHARLGLRRKIFLHIFFSQRFPQKLIAGFRAALPARLHLADARKVFAVECEIFLDERGR